jgi:hypothetical protein
MGMSVAGGGTLRVFGRSLVWDVDENQTVCRSATARGPAPTTVLRLGGHAIPAHAATCFEASFDLQGVGAGQYSSATLSTVWGQAPLNITVTAPAQPDAPPVVSENGLV